MECVHISIKVKLSTLIKSFDDAKLVENFSTIYDLIVRLKPTSAKGTYIKNIAVSSTMGPAIKVRTTK